VRKTDPAGQRRLPGRVYLERGAPVTIVTQWGPRGTDPDPGWLHWQARPRRAGPANVLIRRAGGQLAVRPFRGLRKPAASLSPDFSDAGGAAAVA
jgi:hypothetical protein